MIWLLRLALFALPLLVLWWLLRQDASGNRPRFDGKRMLWLTLALLIMLAGLFSIALLQPETSGNYVPAHMENGQMVPGHLE